MQTLAFETIDNLLLVRFAKRDPTDADYDVFFEQMAKMATSHANPRVLIVTDGGKPSASQRNKVNSHPKGAQIKEMPTVVMTSKAVVRGVITALSWLGVKIKAFKEHEWSAALKWLELDASIQSRVETTMVELEKKLG